MSGVQQAGCGKGLWVIGKWALPPGRVEGITVGGAGYGEELWAVGWPAPHQNGVEGADLGPMQSGGRAMGGWLFSPTPDWGVGLI